MRVLSGATIVLILSMPILLGANPVNAQAFKCVVNGSTTYQDAPCASAPSRAVDTSPSSDGVTGLKQDAERLAVQERAEAKERAQLAREAKRNKPKRPVGWYRENCKANKIGGLTASFDC